MPHPSEPTTDHVLHTVKKANFQNDFKKGFLKFVTDVGLPVSGGTIKSLAEGDLVKTLTDEQHHTFKSKLAAFAEGFVRDFLHTKVD